MLPLDNLCCSGRWKEINTVNERLEVEKTKTKLVEREKEANFVVGCLKRDTPLLIASIVRLTDTKYRWHLCFKSFQSVGEPFSFKLFFSFFILFLLSRFSVYFVEEFWTAISQFLFFMLWRRRKRHFHTLSKYIKKQKLLAILIYIGYIMPE